MGNQQKAQRDKFYQQKQQKLLSTIKGSTSFFEPSVIGGDLTQKEQTNSPQRNSLIGTEWVEQAFVQIRDDITYRIATGAIQLYPPKDVISESQSFIKDSTIVTQFQQLVTSHLDIYEQGIKKMITQYNQEMKMEQITKKQWDEFCSSLEKASFIGKKRDISNKSNAFSYQQYGQSTMSEAGGRYFSTISCDNLSQYQSHNKNNPKIKLMTQEDIAIKNEIRSFRFFLMASQESFVLFQRVIDQFSKGFKEIYGEDEAKVQKQFFADPWQMEKLIEMDIFFIISLNECFISQMMNHYCKEGNISAQQKASLMDCLEGESKTLPIINMLFVSMKPVLNRIRYMLKSTDSIYHKEHLLKPKHISEVIPKKNLQMLNIENPYSQSINQFKTLISLFNKNPFNAVQLIKSILKPLIFREVEQYKQSQIPNNHSGKSVEQSYPKGDKAYQEQEDFQLSTDGTERNRTQKIQSVSEASRNNLTDQLSQGFGAEELLPIYAFIIIKAESEAQSTLYFDLKILNIVFSEVQDRVSSFSEHILNATNLLQSYFNVFTEHSH